MTLATSPTGIALIKKWESCRLKAYRDGGGVWTIGWGHTGPEVKRGLVWTQEKADAQLAIDVGLREGYLNKLLGDAPTTQAQFDALMSFAYNVGMFRGGFQTSTLRGLHQAKEYAAAQLQFRRWDKDNGQPVLGLARRRREEALLYGPRDDKQLTKLGWIKQ